MGTITAQIQLTEAELKLLQTLVYQECGMFFDERRSHFLKDRLQRRLKACQLDSFYSYYRLLTSREGKAEQKRLIEKFNHYLTPGGHLLVGHAESLFGLTQKFRMVHENNGTAYQRIEVAG